eukprot:5159390-Alexandrium_andersonii.AAC.1
MAAASDPSPCRPSSLAIGLCQRWFALKRVVYRCIPQTLALSDQYYSPPQTAKPGWYSMTRKPSIDRTDEHTESTEVTAKAAHRTEPRHRSSLLQPCHRP